MMTQIFKDPNAFAATFQNADPKQIQDVIDILDGLISTNDDQLNATIADWETKNQTLWDAEETLEQARRLDEFALGDLHLAKEAVTEWTNKVAASARVESEAQISQSSASSGQSDAQADFDAQQEQHDKEIEALGSALAVVDQMRNPARRRLLSKVKINPESLDDIEDIIDDLIQKSKDELAAVLAALKEAKNAHDLAKTAYSEAIANHVQLKAELDEKNADRDQKANAQTNAAAALQVAEDAARVASDEEMAADKVRHDEANRVEGENATLNQVRGMLVDLLPKE